MKRIFYFSLFVCVFMFRATAQVVVFSDDFESGLGNWTYTGLWNTTTAEAFSPTHCFTDSPDGNYPDFFSSEAALAVDIDLSSALDADVKIQALVDLETGFDYVYLDASTDGGVEWTNIYVFNGEGFSTGPNIQCHLAHLSAHQPFVYVSVSKAMLLIMWMDCI